MQTINLTNDSATKVENVKKELPVKKEKVVKEKKTPVKKEVLKLNLSSIKDKLQNVTLTETKKRETIYIYPENINSEALRNGKLGKAFRNKQRSKIENFVNNIRVFTKYDRHEDLINEIKNFKSNYKEFYRINDFTVNSISQSASIDGNEKQKKLFLEITEMFEIIKSVEKQTEKKKK
jgi:hypothetical protein